MRRFFILAAFAAVVSSIVGANAQQVQRVQVGVLECRGGASVGFVVGSVTNLGCVLRADGMPEDRYIATIRKVANRVIFMDRGEIVEDAKKEDFFGKPRSERAQQFLSKILSH